MCIRRPFVACLLCQFGTDRPIRPISCCHPPWSDQFRVHCTTPRPAWRTWVRHNWWPTRREKLHVCFDEKKEKNVNHTGKEFLSINRLPIDRRLLGDKREKGENVIYLSNALAASRRPRARPLWARAVFSTMFNAVFRSMLESGLRTLWGAEEEKKHEANTWINQTELKKRGRRSKVVDETRVK